MKYSSLLCLFTALCLLFTGCSNNKSNSSSAVADNFNEVQWEIVRSSIPCKLSAVDIVESTYTKEAEPVGRRLAEYLGGLFVVYPRYAVAMKDSYITDTLTNEYRLMTCLLATDGTAVGEVGASSAMVYQVDEMLEHCGAFITKEQVEAAALSFYGENITITHETTPAEAPPEEQFVYHEDLAVYTYPQKRPMWYLPLLLGVEEASFNSWQADIVFVRYADASQNSFFGLTEPVARWDMESYVNYNIEKYKVYTVTVQEKFGDLAVIDFAKKQMS